MSNSNHIKQIVNELSILNEELSNAVHKILDTDMLTDKDFYTVRYLQLIESWSVNMIKDLKNLY